ncbi:hypothetical protein RYX36_036411, partial [Vicia faba]
SLIPCASVVERNLLADTTKIVDKNRKVFKRKNDLIKIVAENISSLGERLIIDTDFRSEFEIARSTGIFKDRGGCYGGDQPRFDRNLKGDTI